jgi:GDP-mannose mannosyl hydrolase
MIPKEEYGQILEKMPIPCVDLVIHKDKKVLLVKRKNRPLKDEWWVPGGRLYKNELLKDAVKRKAKEEVGFDVEIERELGSYDNIFEDSVFENVKTGTHTVGVTFVVKPKEENFEIKFDETSSDFKWFDKIPEESPELLKKILSDSKVFD